MKPKCRAVIDIILWSLWSSIDRHQFFRPGVSSGPSCLFNKPICEITLGRIGYLVSEYNMFYFVDVWLEPKAIFSCNFLDFLDEVSNVFPGREINSDSCCSISSHQTYSPSAAEVHRFAPLLWETKHLHLLFLWKIVHDLSSKRLFVFITVSCRVWLISMKKPLNTNIINTSEHMLLKLWIFDVKIWQTEISTA